MRPVDNRLRTLTQKATLSLAILLTVFVGFQALRWLVVGQAITTVAEVSSPQQAAQVLGVDYVPYPAAAIPLLAAALLLSGLFARKWLPIAWAGIAILLIFSVLFLFSSGAALLPVAFVLLVLLVILQFIQWTPPKGM
jgi:hypothetical protein